MKKLKVILATIMSVCMLVLATGTLAYDAQPATIHPFETYFNHNGDYQTIDEGLPFIDVSTTITKCIVVGTAIGFYADFDTEEGLHSHRAPGIFGQEGSTFYVGNGYFVTNYHVVVPEQMIIEISKWESVITFPAWLTSRLITIGQSTGLGSVPAEIVWLDKESDIAILRCPYGWVALEDMGFRPNWTRFQGDDLLYKGMPVATIVAIRQEPPYNLDKTPWFEIRYGVIVATGPALPGELPADLLPWFSLNDVSTNLLIYPGDSGSPIFAWIDGQPVLIGLARAAATCPYTGQYLSYFTRIDIVIPFVLEK